VPSTNRSVPDKLLVITEAEMIMDAYNQALQSLNGCLAIINESMAELGFMVFGEIKEGMEHLGHAYSLLLSYLAENLDEGNQE
jgi:hypothetical protein